MALELIYTSAPRGLRAGTSGYCTVAQTRGLRDDLAAALERRSLFTHESKGDSPHYFSFRHLAVGGRTWKVLSRARDAGLDFTGRRHYFAHHLVLEPSEEWPGIQPVDILLGWKGWKESWNESPGELIPLKAEEIFEGLPKIVLPAREWKRQTGDAGWAAHPHRLASPIGWLTGHLSAEVLLRLMGESAALLEESQRGRSWLIPLDAGGSANRVPKDCQWAGRTLWGAGVTLPGVRSVFRIEDCQGKVPEGRPEDLRLARTGCEIKTEKSFEQKNSRAGGKKSIPNPVESHGSGESPSQSKRSAVLWIAVLVLLGAVGWGWLRIPGRPFPPPRSPIISTDSNGEKMAETKKDGPVPPIVPSAILPGERLRQLWWQEAGGKEKIRRLHMLFGRPASVGVIEDEISLLLQGNPEASSLRGPEGPVTLQTDEDRREFARGVSRRPAAWTLYVPSSGRGLIYLPDPFREFEQRQVSAQKETPQEILDDVGRSIFLEPGRWSLVVKFPSWGGKNFTPLRISRQEPEGLWMDRLDQHREQLRGIRMQAWQRAAPGMGDDPDQLDETTRRGIKLQMQEESSPSTPWNEFLKIDDEYRRWWGPVPSGIPPGEVFRLLLKHPEVACELQLDGLAVARIVP